jgi:hypothetical protein
MLHVHCSHIIHILNDLASTILYYLLGIMWYRKLYNVILRISMLLELSSIRASDGKSFKFKPKVLKEN